MRILVIDDERNFSRIDVYAYARTLTEARDWLYGPIDIDVVYLDYDLGQYENVRTLTKEIEEDANDGILLDVSKFVIHSMNPLGRKEMYEALHRFYNVEFARVEDLL